MKVLVCGGRDFSDRAFAIRVLDEIDPAVVIHGGALGADLIAKEWAVSRVRPHWTFPADWYENGKAAGPIRNQQMLDIGKPDLVVAFPGGRGTADMVRRAEKAGVPVRAFSPSSDEGEPT
jgi:hypothetical protein